MYRYHFYNLKVPFWWPNKRLFSYIQRWKTLYNSTKKFCPSKLLSTITSQLLYFSWSTDQCNWNVIYQKFRCTVVCAALVVQNKLKWSRLYSDLEFWSKSLFYTTIHLSCRLKYLSWLKSFFALGLINLLDDAVAAPASIKDAATPAWNILGI